MHPKLSSTIFEWSAGLLIGLIPILCHFLLSMAGGATHEWQGAWTVDVLFVAITTSGLSVVTLFTRLAKGAVTSRQLKPHSMFFLALNMVAFLLSGVFFGEVSTGTAPAVGWTVAMAFLIFATASSLYFEILITIEAVAIEGGADRKAGP